MRHAMKRIWQAVRDNLTRSAGAERTPSVSVVAETAPVAEPRAPTGIPSIAVVPLINVSGQPDQDYFADGIAGDIISQLSRSDALFVAPARRSFDFRGQTTDLKQIVRVLGAGFVLGGTVRRDGEQVRINAKLVEFGHREAGVGQALRSRGNRPARGAGRDRGRGGTGDRAGHLGGRAAADRVPADRVPRRGGRRDCIATEYRAGWLRLTQGRRRLS